MTPRLRLMSRLRLGLGPPRRLGVTKTGVLGVLGVILGATALAGCGVPTKQAASPIAASQVPARVVSPSPSSTTPTTESGLVQVAVYFISTNAYVLPEERFVKPHASFATIIHTLLNGPSTAEFYAGVRTALSSGVHLLSSHVTGNVVTMDFNAAFGQLGGTQEILGVAQVVFTVAANLKSGLGVLFEIDGVPIDVPVASGALASDPVHESEYESLLAPSVTTTTGAS